MPEALIASSTSPGPGVGAGSFWISILRSPRKTTPRMMAPPCSASSAAGPGPGARQRDLDVLRRGPARPRVDLAHQLHDGRRYGRGHPDLSPLRDDVAVHVLDLRAAALDD